MTIQRLKSINFIFCLLIVGLCLISVWGNASEIPVTNDGKLTVINFIRQVVPSYNNNPYKEKKVVGDMVLYPARQNKKLVGMAVKTSGEGYNGPIILMVGFLPNGNIYNICVVEQNETEGLGTRINEPAFKNQFKGKNPAHFRTKVKKDGGQVDAITSATISSRAFCDAVNKAYEVFSKNVKSLKSVK